jgi:hypothetical protein
MATIPSSGSSNISSAISKASAAISEAFKCGLDWTKPFIANAARNNLSSLSIADSQGNVFRYQGSKRLARREHHLRAFGSVSNLDSFL